MSLLPSSSLAPTSTVVSAANTKLPEGTVTTNSAFEPVKKGEFVSGSYSAGGLIHAECIDSVRALVAGTIRIARGAREGSLIDNLGTGNGRG